MQDRRAADLLNRAIAGRGAFRQFKETLFESPELRQTWFEFRDRRIRRRAIQLLTDEASSIRTTARAIEHLSEGSAAIPSTNPEAVARAVASDLRALYGDRLVDVVLYGSHARGDAHHESDIDLAVIPDNVASP